MKASGLAPIKAALKAELLRRDGNGSVAQFGDSAYDFSHNPYIGEKIRPEYGQKTIDLLLKIEDYKDLRLVKVDDPIPKAFNSELLTEIARLAAEQKTGESAKTVANLYPSRKPETSSCRSVCTGLCVGTCASKCNGCTSCTAACGTGCASGCNTACKGGCNTGCNTGCSTTCTGGTWKATLY